MASEEKKSGVKICGKRYCSVDEMLQDIAGTTLGQVKQRLAEIDEIGEGYGILPGRDSFDDPCLEVFHAGELVASFEVDFEADAKAFVEVMQGKDPSAAVQRAEESERGIVALLTTHCGMDASELGKHNEDGSVAWTVANKLAVVGDMFTALHERAESAERRAANIEAASKNAYAELEKIVAGTHPKYVMREGLIIFEPTNETRVPQEGEYYWYTSCMIKAGDVHPSINRFPIYRRVSAPSGETRDQSGEVNKMVKQPCLASLFVRNGLVISHSNPEEINKLTAIQRHEVAILASMLCHAMGGLGDEPLVYQPAPSVSQAELSGAEGTFGPYKGYRGKIIEGHHGEVSGIADVVTFTGDTSDELEIAFMASVDDYLAFCESRNETPAAPAPPVEEGTGSEPSPKPSINIFGAGYSFASPSGAKTAAPAPPVEEGERDSEGVRWSWEVSELKDGATLVGECYRVAEVRGPMYGCMSYFQAGNHARQFAAYFNQTSPEHARIRELEAELDQAKSDVAELICFGNGTSGTLAGDLHILQSFIADAKAWNSQLAQLRSAQPAQAEAKTDSVVPAKYRRTIHEVGGTGRTIEIDIYAVLNAFPTESPAIDHAVKKLLCAGSRGHKSRVDDLREAAVSIQRAIEDATPSAPVAKSENGETIVEIDGKRYRREAVARLPKEGERYFSPISKRVLEARFDFETSKFRVLHEITDETQPEPRVLTGEGTEKAKQVLERSHKGEVKLWLSSEEFDWFNRRAETEAQLATYKRDAEAMAMIRKYGMAVHRKYSEPAWYASICHSVADYMSTGTTSDPADAILSLASQLSGKDGE